MMGVPDLTTRECAGMKWGEAVGGDSPLNCYYRLLEGCEWMVWRVRNPRSRGRYLRVMRVAREEAELLGLDAIHLQVVEE